MASGSAGSIYVDLLLRDSGFQQGLNRANSRSRQAFGGISNDAVKAQGALAGVLNPLTNVTGALGVLGTTVASALSIQKIVQYSDAWRQLQGRLSIVETDMRAVGSAQEALFEIAQRNRSPLETVTNFYQRLNQFVPEAVRNQYDLLGVTESVTAAIAITGENSISAQAALVQFSQAIGTNFEASGQELRSIQEQAPRLAQALANAIGDGTKSLQQLKEEGTLTRDSVLRALSGAGEEGRRMAAELAKIPLTVGQAFTRLDNAFLKFIGQSELVDQGTSNIAASINSLAENLDTVANAFVTLGILAGAKFAGPVLERYSKLLVAETQYQRAVSQGQVVTIKSLEAVKLKAAAELEASRKGVVATEARIAALKKEQAQIIAMRSQYAGMSPASLAGEVDNPSAIAATISSQNGLYAAQNKLTRDLVANKARLSAEEAVLASTTAATSLALTRYNAAALAASMSTRALEAASRLASGALAFLGGPIGLTIAALYASVKVIGYFSSEVRTATSASEALNKITSESNRISQEYVSATKERRQEIRGEIEDLIANAEARVIALNALNMSNRDNSTWEYIKGNWLGLSDNIDETAASATKAVETLGELYKILNNLGKGGKPLGTSTQLDEEQQKEANKQVDELNRLYEKNQRLLQGISQEQFSYNAQIAELDKLLQGGMITYEQYTKSIEFYHDELKSKNEQTFFDMEAIAKRAAENMQDAFADFLFDPFNDGLRGMLLNFVDTMRKMLAQQLSSSIFQSILGTASNAFLSGGFNNAGQSGLPWQSFGNVNPQGGIYTGQSFGGFFADGGYLEPGKWGITGEEGPEMIYGGRTGATIIPNNGGKSGNTYNIDARGTDSSVVRRLEAALVSLAGPGVIEQRVVNAQRRGAL